MKLNTLKVNQKFSCMILIFYCIILVLDLEGNSPLKNQCQPTRKHMYLYNVTRGGGVMVLMVLDSQHNTVKSFQEDRVYQSFHNKLCDGFQRNVSSVCRVRKTFL